MLLKIPDKTLLVNISLNRIIYMLPLKGNNYLLNLHYFIKEVFIKSQI